MFGPSPLLWLLFVPLYQAFLAAGPMAGWFSSPGLLRWCGVATAGSQSIGSWEQLLHRGEALGSRRNSRHQKEAVPTEFLHYLCDTANPRAERRGTQTQPSTPAGWIPQGGGRPRLWWSLPFWQQKGTPSGKRFHRAGKPDTATWERSIPVSPAADSAPRGEAKSGPSSGHLGAALARQGLPDW